MINKKADEKISPLIRLILVVLVLVIVFFSLISFDVFKFFKNLPDFLMGKGPPDELLVDAVVYEIGVKVLLNDGDGRCVVAQILDEDKTNDWLKSYGVRRGELEINKKRVETIDWITEDMVEDTWISSRLLNAEKNAIEELKPLYMRRAESFASSGIQDPSTYSPLTGPSDFGTRYIQAVNEYVINNKDVSLVTFEDKATASEIKGQEFETMINSIDLEKFGISFVKTKINGEDKYLFQSIENNDFAIRGYEIYKLINGEWIKLGEKQYPYLYSSEKLKNQLIKQDLMKACYSEEDDFKDTKILRKPVTLLLKDNDFGGDGKCIIYESKEDNSLEHYSLKYYLPGGLLKIARLYKLDWDGNWENINDKLPSDEEIKIIPLMQGLIQEEKSLITHINSFELELCYAPDMIYDPKNPPPVLFPNAKEMCGENSPIWSAISNLKHGAEVGVGEPKFFTEYDKYIFLSEKDIPIGQPVERKHPRELSVSFLSKSNYQLICQENICFVKSNSNANFAARGGKIYELKQIKKGIIFKEVVESWEPIVAEKTYRYAYLPVNDWNALIRERSIKSDLINECRK